MEGQKQILNQMPLYPLRFKPIFEYRLWGGRLLAGLLPVLPGGPIGEAWLLSDRDGHASLVADGPLKGLTLDQLMEQYPEKLLGKSGQFYDRFPLLLKFLDAHEMLSVQVHPSDAYPELLPAGDTGKTEAWVVMEAGSKSRIYAGLKPGTTADDLRQALLNGKGAVAGRLASFTPKPGDGVFLAAGTVHSMGGDILAFEVQQNSDVTFRLYDWEHVDAVTGLHRALQTEQAFACIDFEQGTVEPVTPDVETMIPVMRERLFHCEYFSLWRLRGELQFVVGATGRPRVLVCILGTGHLEYAGVDYLMGKGDVLLLPAVVGACVFRPLGKVCLFEIALPESILL
jgi:mannose-6-phosphate isomerase